MSKNEIKNIIRLLLIGSIVGGIIGITIPLSSLFSELFRYYGVSFTSLIQPLILLLAFATLFISYMNYKKIMNNDFSLEDDKNNILITKFYNKASKYLVYSNVLFVFLMGLTITVSPIHRLNYTNPSLFYFLISLVTIILSTKLNQNIIMLYPKLSNGDFTLEYGEKNITEKIINLSDEGERLMMLHSLNKTYVSMVYISMFSILVLAFYQMSSGENQIVGMICFVTLLIYSTFTYYKKLEEYNQ